MDHDRVRELLALLEGQLEQQRAHQAQVAAQLPQLLESVQQQLQALTQQELPALLATPPPAAGEGEVLADLRTLLAEGDGTGPLRERIAALEAELAQAQAQAEAQQQELNTATENLARLERRFNEQNDELTAARRHGAELEKMTAAAATRLKEFERELAARRSACEEATQRAAAAEQALQAAEDAQAARAVEDEAGIEQRLDLERRLAELESALAARTANEAELAAALAAAEARAAQAEEQARRRVPAEQIDELQSMLHSERDRADDLAERLKAERSQGTKTVLAEQLANALKELEEVREQLHKAHRGAEAARVAVAAGKGGARSRGGGKKTLGEILLEAELISSSQLEEALEAQRHAPNRHLGGILIEMGIVSEEAVGQALALQTGVHFVRLGDAPPTNDAIRLLNVRLATQHHCVPLSVDGETLTVALFNPLDLVAIEDIERATGKRIDIVVAPASDIRSALSLYYTESSTFLS